MPVKPGLGVYNGNASTTGDADTVSTFGHPSDIASSYYDHTKPGLNVAAEQMRIQNHVTAVVEWNTQTTTYLADIQAGSGPGFTAMQTNVSAIKTLAMTAETAGLPLVATLDHEFANNLNQGKYPNSITRATYIGALSKWNAAVKTAAPSVTTAFWITGASANDADNEAIWMGLTSKPDILTFDPYWSSSAGATTFEGLVGPKVTAIRAWSGSGIAIALTEFGGDRSDADMAAFLTDLRTHMANVGLAWGIFFNRNDSPYAEVITPGGFPQAVMALGASLAD